MVPLQAAVACHSPEREKDVCALLCLKSRVHLVPGLSGCCHVCIAFGRRFTERSGTHAGTSAQSRFPKGLSRAPTGPATKCPGPIPSWSRLAGPPGAVWGWSQVPIAHPAGSCQVHVDSSEAVPVSQAPFPALPCPLALKSTASLPLPQYDRGSVCLRSFPLPPALQLPSALGRQMHGHGPAVQTFPCAQTAHAAVHRAFGEPTQGGSAHTTVSTCASPRPSRDAEGPRCATASLCGLAVQSPAHPHPMKSSPCPPLPPKNRAEMKQPLPSAALSPTTTAGYTDARSAQGRLVSENALSCRFTVPFSAGKVIR